MKPIQTVCVFCGSRLGLSPSHEQAARELGVRLATAGKSLVYGGGAIGLMGVIATAVVREGGNVIGVIPEFLREREVAFNDAQELIITKDMHDRKQIMFDRSDAIVALPGGIGTLEELVEVTTWKQLDRHEKPIIIANLEDFWSPLLTLFDHMLDQGFIDEQTIREFTIVRSIDDVMDALA